MIYRFLLPILFGIIAALTVLNLAPEWILRQPVSQATKPLESAAIPPQNLGVVSYAAAVDAAAPAVVNIYTRKTVKRQHHPIFDDPYFNQFLRETPQQSERLKSSLGSGVIMSSSGYVLTNHHVIRSADEIVIALRDGREAPAMLVGTDPEADLALLKITLDNLPVIQVTSQRSQSIGDVVLAIGNPFGVGQTVTMGIISAIGRNQLGLNTYENYIQTDAAINPGNSGGALINAYGELVGINTAIYSQSGGSEGIGFAIPAETATQVLNDLVTHGATIRGWLGIEVQEANPELLKLLGLPDALNGLIVTGIYPGGPAEQAGLATGDILTMINRQDSANAQRAMNQIAALRPGDRVDLELLRAGKIIRTSAIAGLRESQMQ
ncbi:MAG: trypsin-like peptidase domain-containing protein [Saccharospirillaceae bacterium]|nr:2-alkenal reductase [Thalassolituus sp. HI0120]MCH2042270.1 trypsin-like peptidase domain-containing protein [Saccharospirillaceae bacterium]